VVAERESGPRGARHDRRAQPALARDHLREVHGRVGSPQLCRVERGSPYFLEWLNSYGISCDRGNNTLLGYVVINVINGHYG